MTASPSYAHIALLADAVAEHLAHGRPLVTRTEGHSMWPSIRHGDRVTIIALASAPRVGDVVLVEVDRGLVLHRVIAVGPAGVVTKGDACARPDPPVPLARVLGRVDAPARPSLALASRLSGRLGARLVALARRVVSRRAPR